MPAVNQSDVAEALAARYTLEREIGSEELVVSFLANDLVRQERVVLRVAQLRKELDRKRFVAETRAVRFVEHPNLQPVHDFGEAGEFVYWTVSPIQGETLRRRLARVGTLSIENAFAITRDIADALGHLHEKNFVHLDLRPANVLLTERSAILTDFGTGRLIVPTVEIDEEMEYRGDARYFSPDELRGRHALTPRADLFRLGNVLYEMLVGGPPVGAGSTTMETLKRVMLEPAPLASKVNPELPPGIDRILSKALAKEPNDRFQSTTEFAEALDMSKVPEPARWWSNLLSGFRRKPSVH